MLIREPEKRIELDDIARHEWLLLASSNDECQQQNNVNDNFDVPMIKRKVLSENIQNEIVNSMIKGNIATHEEIKK